VAASDWALKAATDPVRVTANRKASAWIKNILEASAADTYLQYATVKAAFKIQVLAERQLRRVALDRNASWIKALVADCVRIIDECGVRQRIGWREWISVIGGDPQYAIGIDHVSSGPPAR
jgi:hypothetical protein